LLCRPPCSHCRVLPQELDGDLGAGWRLRVASEKSARKFFFMLILSFSYFCAEMTFGVMSGSLAVLADAFHMLTDVAALVCGYWVAQLSMKEKSSTKSFGWKRAEIVGALCNGFVFFVIRSALLLLLLLFLTYTKNISLYMYICI